VYEIKCEEGTFRDHYGNLLHGEYLYVLFPNNVLYGCKLGTQCFHSYLISGLNVKAAGILYCDYGIIITISNESGHYKPTHIEMLPALSVLQRRSLCPFLFEDHSELNPKKSYQGVKYFYAEPDDSKLSLTIITDLEKLKEIINSTIEQSKLLLQARALKIDGTPVSQVFSVDSISYETLCPYYADNEKEQDINDVTIATAMKDDNDFMKQTCLWRMGGKKVSSRFIGKTRQ